MLTYIDPEAQVPPVDQLVSQEEHTAVSQRVITIYKGLACFGCYMHDLQCWRLDTGQQPETVELWAFLPPPIEGLNVIHSVNNPITYD